MLNHADEPKIDCSKTPLCIATMCLNAMVICCSVVRQQIQVRGHLTSEIADTRGSRQHITKTLYGHLRYKSLHI